MGIILDCRNAEACGAIATEACILGKFDAVTLPGAVELFSIAANSNGESHLRREMRAAKERGVAPWSQIVDAWNNPRTVCEHDIAPRPLEFRRLMSTNQSDNEEPEDTAFEQRFRSSLLHSGFPPDFARGMAAVLHEMLDNVRQHSGRNYHPAPAIAGYHSDHHYFSFSVSDFGQGFLSSLTQAPDWVGLKREADALEAVIVKGASRRTGQGQGEGFKSLFKILVDHGAQVRLRSRMWAANVRCFRDGRRAELVEIPEVTGSRVAVCCRLGAATAEFPIIFP